MGAMVRFLAHRSWATPSCHKHILEPGPKGKRHENDFADANLAACGIALETCRPLGESGGPNDFDLQILP